MTVITQPDTPPSAPEQMPASSFSITAPDPGASSAPASHIADGDAGNTYRPGDIGTPMTLPTQDFSVATAHEIGYHGEVNE